MAHMIQGVIFDLGSTLIRYEGDEKETQDRMIADLADYLLTAGVPIEQTTFTSTFAARLNEFFAQRLRDWVEVTAAYILRETLEELGLPRLPPERVERALEAYFAYSETRWRPMPDADATLARLAEEGYRLGLISNASDEANVQRLIDTAGLRRWFDPILVSAALGIRKPNPRIFEMALEAWGTPPEAVVVVGDTLGADVLGAQLTGMRSVWLDSRADAPPNEAHRDTIRPDVTIHGLAELPAVLRALGHGDT